MKDNLVILSGSSNKPLAEGICDRLGLPLTPTNIETFSNGNISAQIGESVRKRDVFIIQSLYPDPNDMLFETCLMIDAAKFADAREVCAVIPHYSYARSDKKDKGRISIGAELVARLMKVSGADRFLTMTLHSESVQGFFRPAKIDHLQGSQILCDYLETRDMTNAVAVMDHGQEKRGGGYESALGIPRAIYNKVRIDDTTVKIESVLGDIEGKDVWLFDDEVASGSSVVTIAELLEADFHPNSISLGSVHGLLCGAAVERIEDSPIREVVVTNTVFIPEEKRTPKIKVLDAAPMFAEGIARIYRGQSISEMFAEK